MYLQQLLRKGKNSLYIAGASIGVFFGFLLLLTGFQFYLDVQAALRNTSNYIVINKKISMLSTGLSMLGMDSGGFTDTDIEDLRKQPFIRNAAAFESNHFRVALSIPQFDFVTEMFAQAVPAEFIDYTGRDFHWHEGDAYVPIILSTDYLALYNFAFAPSQNLPPITSSTLQQFEGTLLLSGNGHSGNVKARIVGFSKRISSILVPPDFLKVMNSTYGEKNKPRKQAIIALDNPNATNLSSYLDAHHYEMSHGGMIGEELKPLLNLLISFLVIVGGGITLLSLLVFLLNFRLMVSESSGDIRLLIQLGYRHQTIARLLQRQFLRLFVPVIIAVIGGLWIAKRGSAVFFSRQGFEMSSMPSLFVLLIAVAMSAFFLLANYMSIARRVKQLAG